MMKKLLLGAFNLFMKDLEKEVEADPAHTPFAVCFFDCNDLKVINDRSGHDKGDIYLKGACDKHGARLCAM